MFDLKAALQQQRERGLYRSRRIVDGASGVRMHIDGRDCLVCCSNDYLGLASHPDVVAAFSRAASEFGAGSGAAHLVSGHHRSHHELEEELAAFVGRDRALLFSTGYMANLAAVTSLTNRHDAVFGDRLNHASLIDAAQLSDAVHVRYAHTDAAALSSRLVETAAQDRLVVTDGVFSMDGDIAPLPQLLESCRPHGAWLMVDDAHGLGVLGEQGRGTLEHYALTQQDVPVLVGTLGKAFGTFGAFVAGSHDLVEVLIQRARSYIYTTALPAAVAEATRASLRIIQQDSARREQLQARVNQFRTGAQQLGLALMDSQTPIQPLIVGDAQRATSISEALLQRGILVTAIRPPTVAEGTARLRVTLSAAHTAQDVEQLLDALQACL